MRAGDLDTKVQVTLPPIAIGQDPGTGETIYSDPVSKDVWAQVIQGDGREFLAANQIMAERRVVFRFRYFDGLGVMSTVIYDGRTHNVQEVRMLGRRRGIELHTLVSV